MRLIALLLSSAVALTACVSIERFPEAWEPIIELGKKDCPQLIGEYSDLGEVPSGKYQVSLASWLFESWDPHNKPDRIAFNLSSDSLTVRTLGGARSEMVSLDRNRGEFTCASGVLMIPRSKSINREGIAAAEHGTLEIARTNNFLVVNSSGGGAGIALLVPVAFYGNNYARFRTAH